MYDELVKELREAEKRAKEICTNPYRFVPYYGKAADAIEELSRDLDSMNEANIALYCALPKWIPVTERLPEEEGYYLTIGPYGAFRVCYYGHSLKHRGYQVFLDQNKKKINAIAWMIIPRYKTKEEK